MPSSTYIMEQADPCTRLDGVAVIPCRRKDGVIVHALVDDDRWDDLNRFKWLMDDGGYAYSNDRINDSYGYGMHIYVMGLPRRRGHIDKQVVDHINRVRHDNRRANLRLISASENCHNRTKLEGTTSKFDGVCKGTGGCWTSSICKDGNTLSLSFKTEVEAALAHNALAKHFYGDVATLNKGISAEDRQMYEDAVEAQVNLRLQGGTVQNARTVYHGVREVGGRWAADMGSAKRIPARSVGGGGLTFKSDVEAAIAYDMLANYMYGDAPVNEITAADMLTYGNKVGCRVNMQIARSAKGA